MQYEVTLTDKQKERMEGLLNDHSTKIADVFGSYVGNYTANGGKKLSTNAKQTYGGYVRALLNAKPELHKHPQYSKLASTYPEWFKAVGDNTPPVVETEVQHANSQRPGVGTPIANPELDDVETKISADPFDVQVATKFVGLYKSATNRGIEFGLTFADVGKLLSRKTCYYTGARIRGTGTSRRTVDRIDSSKGYVTGNVVACTHASNQLKNYLFESEVSEIRMTKKMLEKMLAKLD